MRVKDSYAEARQLAGSSNLSQDIVPCIRLNLEDDTRRGDLILPELREYLINPRNRICEKGDDSASLSWIGYRTHLSAKALLQHRLVSGPQQEIVLEVLNRGCTRGLW